MQYRNFRKTFAFSHPTATFKKTFGESLPWAKSPAVVGAGRVDAVLIGDDLPELGADLVATLAALDSNYLAHGSYEKLFASLDTPKNCRISPPFG